MVNLENLAEIMAKHLGELKGTVESRVKTLDDFAQALRKYMMLENKR